MLNSVRPLAKLNNLPRRRRWPIKWAAVGLTAFLVSYPYPHLFLQHARRWQNPNAMVNPSAPALAPLADELRDTLDESRGPAWTLRQVDRFVTERIRYEHDWVTWGVADYLPTVEEVLEQDREDCDGRAVVAASLMRNLGHRAELVSDFTHVWVKTDHGEFMGPRQHKAVEATPDGVRVNWSWRLVVDYADAMAYGVAVFPLPRELIFLTVVWLALVSPQAPPRRAGVAGLLLLAGLFVLRAGGGDAWQPIRWLQVTGAALVVSGALPTLKVKKGTFYFF